MLDNISEFSRSSFRPIIPRSEIDNAVSRNSSIRSLQRSVPDKIQIGKDIKSAASGSMRSIEGPKTTLTDKTEKKNKFQAGRQLMDLKQLNHSTPGAREYGPSYQKKDPRIQNSNMNVLPRSHVQLR